MMNPRFLENYLNMIAFLEYAKSPLFDKAKKSSEALIQSKKNIDLIRQNSKIASVMKSSLGLIKKHFSELPEVITNLSSTGWFFPRKLASMWGAHVANDFIEAEDIDGLDNYMLGYLKETIQGYKALLKKNFPGRTHLFDSIFLGIEQQNYNLVIPAIYCQIDGIVFDYCNKPYFTKKKKRVFETSVRTKNTIPYRDAIYEILNENEFNAFSEHTNSIANRHNVIHGFVVDYGTEVNTFKVLSMLLFIAEIIIEVSNES